MKNFIKKIKFYAMRSIRSRVMRNFISIVIGKMIGKVNLSISNSKLINSQEELNVHLNNLNKDGFSELNQSLPDYLINEIINYSTKLLCFDPFNKKLKNFSLLEVNSKTHVANYFREDLVKFRPIMDIANDPSLLYIAQEFLGAKPTISNINMWWSFGGREKAADAQLFHRDVDDFKFLKLFIYLTNVTKEQGPHVYVKGSSNISKFLKIRRYDDDEIIRAFGHDNIVEFSRPKGSIFFVDTYGFHKGLLPVTGDRLILQIQYSLNPIGVENYSALLKHSYNYDNYINRCLIS